MSGNGSQTSTATPWGPATPYLLDIMQQAQKQYGASAGQYANPAGNFNFGNATGAVGDILTGANPYGSMATTLSPDVTKAIQQQLSGQPDYTAAKAAIDAANQQTWNSFNNTEIPQLNQRASFLGNPSGAVKDLNWATANIGQNMDLNAQQQYLGLEEAAKNRQANAMGLGAGIAQGAGSQQLQGANLYQSLTQLPQTNLADYASIVSGTGGKFGTDTTKLNPGSGQTAANIIGGLTAGAGLANTLFGGSASTGGTVGAIKTALGGLGSGAIDTTALGSATGSAASTAGSTAIGSGLSDTAASVAADNAAWLSGGGGAAGAAGASAAAEPALASIGTGAVDAASASAAANAAAATGSAAAGGGAAGETAAATTLGAGLGGTTAVALPLAVLAAGYFQAGVKMPASYYAGILKGLNSSKNSPEYQQASQEVIAQIASNDQDRRGIALPQAIQDKARELGLFDSAKAMQQAAAYMQSHTGYAPARGKTSGVSLNRY